MSFFTFSAFVPGSAVAFVLARADRNNRAVRELVLQRAIWIPKHNGYFVFCTSIFFRLSGITRHSSGTAEKDLA
jgi:hypothetical protein